MAKKKILIVDDTKTWLAFHKEVISEFYGEEAETVCCENALQALKVIHENLNPVFDVIITDMQMGSDYSPLEAGEWLVRNIKMIKEYKDIPVIIISGVYNIDDYAKRLKVDSISKSKLLGNRLLFKYTLEKVLAV